MTRINVWPVAQNNRRSSEEPDNAGHPYCNTDNTSSYEIYMDNNPYRRFPRMIVGKLK